MLGLLCALFASCAVVATPAPSGTAPGAEISPPVAASQASPTSLGEPPGAKADPSGPMEPGPQQPPAWRQFAVAPPPTDGKPTIAVMIDDMGIDRRQSDRAVAMPGPLTLSWLPYGRNLSEQIAAGRAHGHEIMLHMPMEPLGRTNPGPDALRTWLSPDTNRAYLRAALAVVPGAVGLNQHEGSVASLSTPLMDLVMTELRTRGMLFVDSLTISHSVALGRARAAGLPSVPRDVFLDNDANPGLIHNQLTQAEGLARRFGHVIVIGHPRPVTMDVLSAYLPTVASRGFVLWPVAATVAAENQVQMVQDRAEPAAAE